MLFEFSQTAIRRNEWAHVKLIILVKFNFVEASKSGTNLILTTNIFAN